MRTRVKICGITRAEDALSAARLGADAIGLVFYEASPRNVTIKQAQALLKSLPPFVSRVGLFVDASPAKINYVIDSVPLDLLQFHGNETAADCGQFGLPYIKAIRMKADTSLPDAVADYADAAGFLLDAHSDNLAGGSGKTFDWGLIPAGLNVPIVLAGGLGPDNVAAAIAKVQPYGVDVSSGVELSKGIKDAEKISAFINEVNKQL